jgi:hypothetical protein
MARIVTFSDSFVSASEPQIEGVGQENYTIINNASSEVLFTIDADNYKSAFFSYELIRKDVSNSYIETGKMQLIYDGTNWNFAKNIFINDELIVSDLVNPEHVVFSMQTTDGVGELIYNSGNMGSNYEGTFRISIVRIVTL